MNYLTQVLLAISLFSFGVFLNRAISSQETQNLQSSNIRGNNQDIYKSYVQWKKTYNKNINGPEDEVRFLNYKENYKFVQQANQEAGEEAVALNILAALTNQEYRQIYLNDVKPQTQQKKSNGAKTFKRNPNFKAPTSINWVEEGAVAPVQDQANCGSCWAFGSVGGLEGAYAVATGNLVKLSEQQLVDCNRTNMGCKGGLEIIAYQYTKKKGIQTGESYPYTSGVTGKRGKCEYDEQDVVFKNDGYFQVEPANDPDAIVEALTQQPLSKGIDAGSIFFQLYSGKTVFNNKNCGEEMNHSVTMVGFQDDAETPYWVIKNSYGTGWGKKGYMQIAKSSTNEPGICGINIDSTAPTYEA